VSVRVSLVMGSKSDLARLESCVALLGEMGIESEVRVLSAHRTPKEVADWAEGLADRGVEVVLAAAGGSAALAGVVAAHTLLPVIGIPMDNPPLGGLDSLLSTVQMPGGIPVAAVAVGGGGPKNAALLAARIVGLGDEQVRERLAAHREDMRRGVLDSDAEVQGS